MAHKRKSTRKNNSTAASNNILDAHEYLDFLNKRTDVTSPTTTCITPLSLLDSDGLCEGLSSADITSRLMSIDWKNFATNRKLSSARTSTDTVTSAQEAQKATPMLNRSGISTESTESAKNIDTLACRKRIKTESLTAKKLKTVIKEEDKAGFAPATVKLEPDQSNSSEISSEKALITIDHNINDLTADQKREQARRNRLNRIIKRRAERSKQGVNSPPVHDTRTKIKKNYTPNTKTRKTKTPAQLKLAVERRKRNRLSAERSRLAKINKIDELQKQIRGLMKFIAFQDNTMLSLTAENDSLKTKLNSYIGKQYKNSPNSPRKLNRCKSQVIRRSNPSVIGSCD